VPPAAPPAPPTERPAPMPPVQVQPIAEKPKDVFCAASSSAQGPVGLREGGLIDEDQLPKGYTVISKVGVSCSGNYLDLTLSIPDNYKDIRAFMLYDEGQKQLGTEPYDSAKCGPSWTENLRQQQVSNWKKETMPSKELTAIEQIQKVFAPTDAERIVIAGNYQVELLTAPDQGTNVRLSSPTFDVPQAAHPNLVIIGTPLLATFTPVFSSKVRITMPYGVPEFIDPFSVALYVRVGDQWRYLESTYNPDQKIVTAIVNDISLFVDNAGTAMFAVMGITCATCPNIAIEKLYDGGSRKAVFLVHGFTTDRLRWQAFIDDLVHTNSDWQVWTISYPLALTSNEVAKELSSLIEQHTAEYDKVSFIMHSIGGIIVQKALKHGTDNGLAWQRKAADVILAGQPGLGSPSAEVYGRLFAALVNLKSAAMVWNQRSPLLVEAVQGIQVPRAPGAEYFVIAGRQSYPFTYQLFQLTEQYQPNDGIITIYSARTVGGKEINDTCEHYFEVPRTHTDLLDDWLPRRVMQRVLFRNDAQEQPGKAIAGYNKYARVVDQECKPGTLVVLGKPIDERATADPLNCKCGNGICGEGEDEINCPQDCVTGFEYRYFCRILPWIIGPLVLVLVLLTAIFVYNAIQKHERSGKGASLIAVIALIIFLLILAHYLLCGFTMPLTILMLVFVLALLGFTVGHLHGEQKRQQMPERQKPVRPSPPPKPQPAAKSAVKKQPQPPRKVVLDKRYEKPLKQLEDELERLSRKFREL